MHLSQPQPNTLIKNVDSAWPGPNFYDTKIEDWSIINNNDDDDDDDDDDDNFIAVSNVLCSQGKSLY